MKRYKSVFITICISVLIIMVSCFIYLILEVRYQRDKEVETKVNEALTITNNKLELEYKIYEAYLEIIQFAIIYQNDIQQVSEVIAKDERLHNGDKELVYEEAAKINDYQDKERVAKVLDTIYVDFVSADHTDQKNHPIEYIRYKYKTFDNGVEIILMYIPNNIRDYGYGITPKKILITDQIGVEIWEQRLEDCQGNTEVKRGI